MVGVKVTLRFELLTRFAIECDRPGAFSGVAAEVVAKILALAAGGWPRPASLI
jgi:hypothetical protein